MIKRVFIFCDFDGVLLTWKDYLNTQKTGNARLQNGMLKAIDELFKDVKGIEVYFIPISSWSFSLGGEKGLKELFEKEEIKNLKIFQEKPSIRLKEEIEPEGEENAHFLTRAYWIKRFIEKYQPFDYLILDDEFTESYWYYNLKHLRVNAETGLTSTDWNLLYNYINKFLK